MGIGFGDGGPAVLGVPPDEEAVFAAAGEHFTVAAPGQGTDGGFVLGQGEEDAAASGVPEMDAAGAV